MFRTQVTVIDAVVVVTLMESSMLSAALISADNALHSTFPEDAMKEYHCQGSFAFTFPKNLIFFSPTPPSPPHLAFPRISEKDIDFKAKYFDSRTGAEPFRTERYPIGGNGALGGECRQTRSAMAKRIFSSGS